MTKLFNNPLGAGLSLGFILSIFLGILALARIFLTSTYPPTGAIMLIPMFVLGKKSFDSNKDVFFKKEAPYKKWVDIIPFILGIAIVVLMAWSVTLF